MYDLQAKLLKFYPFITKEYIFGYQSGSMGRQNDFLFRSRLLQNEVQLCCSLQEQGIYLARWTIKSTRLSIVIFRDFFQGEVFSFAVSDKIFEFVSLQGKQVFNFEIAIGQHILNDKFMFLTKIDESVFFASAKY